MGGGCYSQWNGSSCKHTSVGGTEALMWVMTSHLKHLIRTSVSSRLSSLRDVNIDFFATKMIVVVLKCKHSSQCLRGVEDICEDIKQLTKVFSQHPARDSIWANTFS